MSHNTILLNLLKKAGKRGLTTGDIEDVGIGRPASRIHELRKVYRIDTKKQSVCGKLGPAVVARYCLK